MKSFNQYLWGGVLILLSSCATYSDLDNAIDQLEETRIATINQQIAAINGSLESLSSLSYSIDQLAARLQEEIDIDKSTIVELNEKDAVLEEQISILRQYLNSELSRYKDWTQATFATLEQYNATVSDIAAIKVSIEAVKQHINGVESSLYQKIETDIANAVNGLQSWVNSQLTQYYTIAQIDEKVKILEKSIQDGDNQSAADIKKLKEDLEAQKVSITSEYKSAISEAISTNNGIIDGKIQTAITSLNARIDTEVASITEQLATVFSRLDSIDASLLEIYGLLRIIYPTSISIISSNSVKMGFGKTAIIDFRVSPSEASFNYDVTSSECDIELDYLGANTKAGYVTTPTHVALTKVEPVYDEDQNKLQGQYRAYITDKREKKKYDDRLGLVLTVPGQNGTDVQISSSAFNVSLTVGRITAFTFMEKDNPKILQEDLICEVKDNYISGRIPHLVEEKLLVPSIQFEGEGKIIHHASPNTDIHSKTDFSRPVIYDIIDEETEEVINTYEVSVSAFTGLPVMNIYTENDAAITSKETYINAKIEIIDYTTEEYNFPRTDVQIKGRGNTTWSMPKKPYRLKFDKKKQLFGESNNKNWVLLANYSDKTSIRTSTAFYMGEISKLEWTPCTHFVELFINNVYQGTYQLTEQIKIAKDRVNVSDDGYLMEIDQLGRLDPGDVYFTTNRLLACIKDPDVETDSERYNWIKNYVNTAENALYSDDFLDVTIGYKAYFDVDSFVDWYLINEITKNNDAVMYSSCYMNIKPGGKLKMGPLWDYDISLGNINYNGNQTPDGFWMKDAVWISRMFEDPEFVLLVRSRFNYFKSHLDDIYSHINAEASYLKYSVVENNNMWETLYTATWPNYAIWGVYQNEVEYMKQFLTQRMSWLDANLP